MKKQQIFTACGFIQRVYLKSASFEIIEFQRMLILKLVHNELVWCLYSTSERHSFHTNQRSAL